MNGWVRDSLTLDAAHDNPLHERLLEEEKDNQSGQEHRKGGGHQPVLFDDGKLAIDYPDPEHGHRRAGHDRGQTEDGAAEGDTVQGLIKRQRQQLCEVQIEG